MLEKNNKKSSSTKKVIIIVVLVLLIGGWWLLKGLGCNSTIKESIQDSLNKALSNPETSYASGTTTNALTICANEVLTTNDFTGNFKKLQFADRVNKSKSIAEQIGDQFTVDKTTKVKQSTSCTTDLVCTIYISEF